MIKIALFVILSSAFLTSLRASVRLPSIFGDNMILQQETSNAIWGWAEPGETVTVKASWGSSASTQAGKEGKWKVFLKTPSHGTGHTLSVRGQNSLEINNVAIGEVWLCAGQSNMGWALFQTFGAEEEMPRAKAPDFRIYKSMRNHWFEPLDDTVMGSWDVCEPETAAVTSAVSYFFGKKLHDALGIPVGIIVQAYAGTPIEGWMPWEVQKDNPWSQDRKAFYEDKPQKPSKEEALATYQKELAEYNAQVANGTAKRREYGRLPTTPIITKPASLGHQVPANIFNGMIHPIRPYGIRGAIWYQAERNAKNTWTAAGFRSQLKLMVDYYRQSWHELSDGNVAQDFPFFFTQLPSWGLPQEKPVEGDEAAWAVIRETTRLATQDIPNTGIAVGIDTGSIYDLHPKNKKPIGLRHAYLALRTVYGKDVVASGPLYKDSQIRGNQIEIEFDSVGSGLMKANPGKLDSFAIAGEDRQWHWAEAAIKGDKVLVSSPEVRQPVAVRYAWAQNPSQRNLLYNKEGLPASPFRTDDWPLFEKNYGQDTTYHDPKKEKPENWESKDWKRPEMTQ